MSEESKARYAYTAVEDDILKNVYEDKKRWTPDTLAKYYNVKIKEYNDSNNAHFSERSGVQIRTHMLLIIKNNNLPNKFIKRPTLFNCVNQMKISTKYFDSTVDDFEDELLEYYNNRKGHSDLTEKFMKIKEAKEYLDQRFHELEDKFSKEPKLGKEDSITNEFKESDTEDEAKHKPKSKPKPGPKEGTLINVTINLKE